MIAIIDYGMGNLGSICNMFKKIGVDAMITSNHQQISTAEKLVLPGVGSFDAGMKNLKDSGLELLLYEEVIIKKKPILGICLGMHLMTKRSEEGSLQGLGWIDAETILFKFPTVNKLKVPHMGWNIVNPVRISTLTQGMEIDERFYFVHSYYVRCKDKEAVTMTAKYDLIFDAGFEQENIIGVQFHPEKSHKYGMELLRKYAGII